MAYRDSSTQLLSRILELEATLDGLRPRIEALEASVSRLDVSVAVLPAQRAVDGDPEAHTVADEVRDKQVAEQVGDLSLRVKALEQQLAVKPRRAKSDDDLRALVDAELGTTAPKRRR